METNSDERKIIDRVLHRDMVFRYQLLGHLQADCEDYLNYGNRNIRRLWDGYSRSQGCLLRDRI